MKRVYKAKKGRLRKDYTVFFFSCIVCSDLKKLHICSLLHILCQNALRTLTYIARGEVDGGVRTINVTVSDRDFSSSLLMRVRFIPRNNQRPALTARPYLQYYENDGVASIGAMADIRLSDGDNEALFLMRSATIQLDGNVDKPLETIAVTADAPINVCE